MRNYFLVIVVFFLILSTCQNVSANALFYEDFSSDLSKWNIAGSPTPSIVNTKGNPAPSFCTNDDLNYGGWAVSKQTFDYSSGMAISLDMKPGHASFPDQRHAHFQLLKNNSLYTKYSSIKRSEFLIKAVLTSNEFGTTPGFKKKTPGPWISFYIRYKNNGEEEVEEKLEIPLDDGSGWHNLRINIMQDQKVQFRLDGEVLYNSKHSLPLEYSGECALGLGSRLCYHDNVTVSKENINKSVLYNVQDDDSSTQTTLYATKNSENKITQCEITLDALIGEPYNYYANHELGKGTVVFGIPNKYNAEDLSVEVKDIATGEYVDAVPPSVIEETVTDLFVNLLGKVIGLVPGGKWCWAYLSNANEIIQSVAPQADPPEWTDSDKYKSVVAKWEASDLCTQTKHSHEPTKMRVVVKFEQGIPASDLKAYVYFQSWPIDNYQSIITMKTTEHSLSSSESNEKNNISLFDSATSTFWFRSQEGSSFTKRFGSSKAAQNGYYQAFTGNWDGDGDSEPGIFDKSTSQFWLLADDGSILNFRFGNPENAGYYQAIVGDWNGDGEDTVGIFDETTSKFWLSGVPETGDILSFKFGNPDHADEYQAVSGDWNGDGIDDVGIFVENLGKFWLRDNSDGSVYSTMSYGDSSRGDEYQAIAGDWDQDQEYEIGLYDKKTSIFWQRNDDGSNLRIKYGSSDKAKNGEYQAIIGSW